MTITESSETAYVVHVVVNDQSIKKEVEFVDITQFIENKPWVRENFLKDVRKMADRIYFAGVLQEMMSIVVESEGDIVQVVFEADQSRFSNLRETGHVSVVSEESKVGYFIKEVGGARPNPYVPYEGTSTDVTHIDKFYEFHTNKIVHDQRSATEFLMVDINDIVVFIGFNPHSDVVYNFRQCNYNLQLDHHVLTDGDDIKKIIGESSKIILVANQFSVALCTQVVSEFPKSIKLCVCDVDESFGSTMLLSACKRHNILHVRKVHRTAFFNFGVTLRFQRCDDHRDDANNGVITMSEDTWIEDRSFIIYMDPRYADIVRCVDIMECADNVWAITIIHVVRDDVCDKLYEYTFKPTYQTKNINHLCNVARAGQIHTVLAVYTKFPNIANRLADSSVFVTCDKEKLLEYNNNVTAIFKARIKGAFVRHINYINNAKAITNQMKKKVELVKDAYQIYAKKCVNKLIHNWDVHMKIT
jgi:hypothetical protein